MNSTSDIFDNHESEVDRPRTFLNIVQDPAGNFKTIGPISAATFASQKLESDLVINAIPHEMCGTYIDNLVSADWHEENSDAESVATESAAIMANEIAEANATDRVSADEDFERDKNESNVVGYRRPTDCYTAKQVARKIGIDRRHLYMDHWRNKLGAFQIAPDGLKGTKVYFPKCKVNEYLDNLKN